MTFWKRLRTYLVGVGLGLLIVYIIFGDRDLTAWTPQGRVLTTIDSSSQSYSDLALCQMQCLHISDSILFQIQDEANVDFSESDTRKKPCPEYKLYSAFESNNYVLRWKVCEDQEEVELLSIVSLERECPC